MFRYISGLFLSMQNPAERSVYKMSKIGIGIDTGGTYTDAVIFDLEKKKVLASAKSLTTKQDLSIGIDSVLCKLEKEIIAQTEIVGLSTTLATNACVENRPPAASRAAKSATATWHGAPSNR